MAAVAGGDQGVVGLTLDESARGRSRIEAGVGDGSVEDDATVAEPHGIDASGTDIESENPH